MLSGILNKNMKPKQKLTQTKRSGSTRHKSVETGSKITTRGASFASIVGAAILLAGCAADDPSSAVSRVASGSIFSGNGAAGSEVDLDRFKPRTFCPLAVVPDGWNLRESRARSSSQESDPKAVIYQAAINKVARECQTSGDTITVRLGVAGRVTLGPSADSLNAAELPLSIAVFDRSTGERISIEKRAYAVNFVTGQPTALWQVVYPDISVPVGNQALEVRVGFAP